MTFKQLKSIPEGSYLKWVCKCGCHNIFWIKLDSCDIAVQEGSHMVNCSGLFMSVNSLTEEVKRRGSLRFRLKDLKILESSHVSKDQFEVMWQLTQQSN